MKPEPATRPLQPPVPRPLSLAYRLVPLAFFLLLFLSWQRSTPITLDLGGLDDLFVSGFYPQETAGGRSYRWSEGEATIVMPGAGLGDWDATLTLASGRAEPVEFTIRADERVLGTFSAAADYQDYSFTIPAAATRLGDVELLLRTATFTPQGENRELGLALDRLVLAPRLPMLPAPLTWIALGLALVGGWLTLRLAVSEREALLAAVFGTMLLTAFVDSQRLAVTPFASYLLMIGAGAFASIYVLRACWRRFGATSPGLALLPALAIGFGVLWLGGQITVLSRQPLPDDFVAMLRGAEALAAGQLPYKLDVLRDDPFGASYKYPPLFALLLAPLLGLPERVALGVWNGFNLLALGVAVFAVLRAHGRKVAEAAPGTLGFLFLALLFQPNIDTLTYGQLDLALLGLVALTYWASRAGRPELAGVPLALAVVIKLYPAVLLIYLLWRREWRALASFAVAALAFVGGGDAVHRLRAVASVPGRYFAG